MSSSSKRAPAGRTPPELPARRKAELATYVSSVGEVSVATLAGLFNVSTDTIRRDLDELDALGRVIRTHGGAVSVDMVPKTTTGVDVRKRLHAEEKSRVGRIAATLVRPDASIIINGGTTALALVEHLEPGLGLRIVTNNLQLPAVIAPGVADEIFVVGGPVRPCAQTTTGDLTTALGQKADESLLFQCDIAFIGVGAMSSRQGLSTGNIAEATLMRQMIDHSDQVVILADSSKLGRGIFARIGPIELADVLVTDKAPDAESARPRRDPPACAASGVPGRGGGPRPPAGARPRRQPPSPSCAPAASTSAICRCVQGATANRIRAAATVTAPRP